MRKIVQIILLVITVVISACNNTEDPFSIATGRVNAEIKDYKINGEAPLSIDYNPDFNDYDINAFIVSGDTIEFTLEVLFESTLGADVYIDSIVFDQSKACHLETAKIIEALSSYENKVASGEVFKKQYRYIYEGPECILGDLETKYIININITGRPTAQEEIDFGTDYDTDLSIDAFIPTAYEVDTFRLYNNYVGKDFNEGTGIGYDFIKQEYAYGANYIYCFYNEAIDCGSQTSNDYILINLTYDSLYNPEDKIFVPAFSFSHPIRNRNNEIRNDDNLENNDFFKLLSTTKKLFDAYRRHPIYGFDDSTLITHPDLIIRQPRVNDWYIMGIRYNTNYLKVIAIEEDGFESYIDFVSYIPK